MSEITIARLVLAVAAGAVMAFFYWRGEVEEARRAVALLHTGTKVFASVTSATIRRGRGSGFKRGRIEYEFTLANGQTYSGQSDVYPPIVRRVSDPADSSRLLPDASVQIAYLAGNPSVNGVVEDLRTRRKVAYHWVVGVFALAAMLAFKALTWLMERIGLLEGLGEET